jgi:phenylalanyl-tRNA synthetase beta chain
MYLSLNWIKNYISLPKGVDNKQIGLDLTMSTVEVEEIINQEDKFKNIVVGKIKGLTKHPKADRLQVCKVDLGGKIEQIVCGGSNLSKGMLVAVATVGSKVQWHGEGEYITLGKVKIRGVESNGMIAASSEIGLSELFPNEGEKDILDLSEFKFKPGQSLSSALELNDIIIDIDNKSINHRPDLWGQYGLAREVAAIYKLKLKEYIIPTLDIKEEIKLKVSIKDKKNCFRYNALSISNVKVEESPWWLKKQLQSVGIRPINNIVDITNYVMYELGQPLHAFDSQQISNNSIEVKKAKKGEEFIALDGIKYTLPNDALMIADKDKYIALAGIMGGQNSEIASDTTDIILESANFKASNIRRTSTSLGLRSESSSRFEKSLDPVLTELAIKKAAALILSLSKGSYISSKLVDIDNNPFKEISLNVSEELINNRFGIKIPSKEIKGILQRLQFNIEYKKGVFNITVPSFRATKDISIPEDIVEEVARIYGYDNIEPRLPIVAIQEPDIDIVQEAEYNTKQYLVLSQSYNEVYNYPFSDLDYLKKLDLDVKDHIQVLNPVSPEQKYLNTSLLPNLLKKAEENLRWYDEFSIFELQRVFRKEKGTYQVDDKKKDFLPKQDKYLAGVEVSKGSKEESFLQLKGTIESLFSYWNIDFETEDLVLTYADLAYSIKYQDIILGNFGVLHNSDNNICFWELNFSLLSKYINNIKEYKILSKFPSIERDMAIIVNKDIKWTDIEKEVYKVSVLIKHVNPFDIFRGKEIGESKKSIAFHIEFRSEDKTLVAEDIDEIMDKILKVLDKKFKAVLR